MKRIINMFRYLLISILLSFLLLSCQNVQKVPERTLLESGVVPLDAGAAVYALFDVARARPILEGISYIPANDNNIKMMLDKTQSAVVAVFSPSSVEDRLYQLVSWGSYPASLSSIAFGASKDWARQRSAYLNTVYWHSEKSQMSVAVSSSQAYVLVAMTKIPHDPIPSPEGIKIPGGFGEFARDSVFSCWLSNPAPTLNQRIKEMGIPLEIPAEQLFVRVFPADDQASVKQSASAKQPSSASQAMYEAHVQITLPSATQARTIVSFLALARNFMTPAQPSNSQDGGKQNNTAIPSDMLSTLLFANPVVQEGASLIIKSPPLSAQEISLLFSVFSL